MKIPPRPTAALSHFVKSPENLGRLIGGIEVAEVLKTTDLAFPINYLEKPIDVWAKRKTTPSIRDRLELHHTGIVNWFADKQQLLIENSLVFKKNAETSSIQGEQSYGVTVDLTTENVLVSSYDMNSKQSYKLGRIIHGLTSKAYREMALVFKQLIPSVFCTLNESTPFHLACGAILTKFKGQQDIILAIRAKPNTTIASLKHPDVTPRIVTAILETFKKREDFDEDVFLALLPTSVLGESQYDIDYCMMMPQEARKKLEEEFEQALIPPSS
jgi:hypothetical protein